MNKLTSIYPYNQSTSWWMILALIISVFSFAVYPSASPAQLLACEKTEWVHQGNDQSTVSFVYSNSSQSFPTPRLPYFLNTQSFSTSLFNYQRLTDTQFKHAEKVKDDQETLPTFFLLKICSKHSDKVAHNTSRIC